MNKKRLQLGVLVWFGLALHGVDAHGDIGSCVNTAQGMSCIYTRARTTLQIPVIVSLPLTQAQLAYADSQLTLVPVSDLITLHKIVFRQIESGEEAGENLYVSSANELDIQAVGTGDLPLQSTVLQAVGAHLFYNLNDAEKQQMRDLFQAVPGQATDDAVAQSFGTCYATWLFDSTEWINNDLQLLMNPGRSVQAPADALAFSQYLTAASFFADNGQIAVYSDSVSLEPLQITPTTMQIGAYTLLLSGGRIIGTLDFRFGPTHGQPIYFQAPVILPALAWNQFGDLPRGPLHPVRDHTLSAVPRPVIFTGSEPDYYVPMLTTKGQNILRRESTPPPTQGALPDPRDPGPHFAAPQ